VTYQFRVPASFRKTARKKPQEMRQKLEQCIKALAANPRDPVLHTHKMKGTGKQEIWEAYIDNDGNRITFEWDKGVIVLRNNCNHDMLYRNP
jgi:mRNA-degrading endonuclease YafQ of YafQ-DinJ toxin-antitoxin module